MAASIVFGAIFAISAAAQVPTAAPAGTGKIGLVNTLAFGEEKAGAGITKYKTALKAVDDEFKQFNAELQALGAKYTALGNEIKVAQEKGGPPVDPKALQAKVIEFQDLETQIKRKQEDGKKRYELRTQAVVGPVFNDILKALSDYAKQKGYALILDGVKLEQSEMLMGFDDKYDVTKDFITFYNSRPATAATASVPK